MRILVSDFLIKAQNDDGPLQKALAGLKATQRASRPGKSRGKSPHQVGKAIDRTLFSVA